MLTGAVSGAVGSLAKGGEVVARIGYQALGSAAGSAASTTVSEAVDFLEKGKPPELQPIFTKSVIGIIGGSVGAATGVVAGNLMSQAGELFDDTIEKLASQVLKEASDDVAAVASEMIKKGLEGSASSATSKVATNLYENFCEEDKEKVKPLREGVLGAAMIGFLIGGATGGLKELRRVQELNQATAEVIKTREELNAAQTEKNRTEKNLKSLEKNLGQSQELLAEKQSALERLQKTLQENQSQQQSVENHIETTESSIQETKMKAETAKQQLASAKQEVLQAQEQVRQNQQAVNEAQQTAHTARLRLQETQQNAQRAQQIYDQNAGAIKNNVHKLLRQGQKAKIDGKRSNSPEEITEAYLKGRKVEWKQGNYRAKEQIQVPWEEQLREARQRVAESQQNANEVQNIVEQKQAELQSAIEHLEKFQSQVEQTYTETQAAQDVELKQAELRAAQARHALCRQEAQFAEQEMHMTQQRITELEQQQSTVQEQKLEMESELENALAKERELTSKLASEKQAFEETKNRHEETRKQQANRFEALFSESIDRAVYPPNRIYTNKHGIPCKYVATDRKPGGSAIGAIFQKSFPTKGPSPKPHKWVGKIGDTKNLVESYNYNLEDINLDAIFEKITYDFYQKFGEGFFEVPKSRLSEQPLFLNEKLGPTCARVGLKPDDLFEFIQRNKDKTSIRIMSKMVNEYQDLGGLKQKI